MSSNGIDWYPMDTDFFSDDEKAFDLMYGEGAGDPFAEAGHWKCLMERIYRNGPALEVDGRMARKLAREHGWTVAEMETFIERCVAAGLLDAGMWERSRVLTSRGIQRRWMQAKKRRPSDGLYAEFQQWSLLDGDGGSQALASSRSGSQPLASSRNGSQDPALDKTRLDETREDEDPSSSSLEGCGNVENPDGESRGNVENPATDGDGPAGGATACLSRGAEDGTVFLDDADCPHRTPLGALEQRYASRTGRSDFRRLMGEFGALCPGGCRGDPERRRECYGLLSRALDSYDATRGSPVALVRTVVRQDRGW